ncbi:hypothetical protein B0H17DRAFT_31802 [Mycena rosella]|uniref:Uncharacterized protein n=1 Tax=Mycena rosella TaxID=1033263 RepID=A0AAD7DBG0_MYCRO|nr:hypothetical protein B0H17DRAFT_31802 [Mycena rosella]
MVDFRLRYIPSGPLFISPDVVCQSPPVTPPRTALSPPLNPACRPNDARRNHIPRRSQPNAALPPAHSLAHANARLVHERLQQNHHRLQVQLHARPPVPSHAPAAAAKAFPSLDTTFRAYASRIQTEFNSLRAACARAVQREQHHAAEMRGTCARLAHERDVAEEKLRVLLDRRARAAKRTRDYVEKEDAEADAELEARSLMYPASPPQLPTQSPPPRLLSPFLLAARRSPSHTPDPEDTTGFDLTVACDTLPRPSKRRRTSDSSERTLVASPESDKHATTTTTTERETCPPAGESAYSGECDMDLESESESESETDARSSTRSQSPSRSASRSKSPRSASRAVSRSTSRSPSRAPPARVETPSEQQATPPPSAIPRRASLALEYVDIMYMPTDGKLVCRVCLLAATGSKPRAAPIQAFVPGASWDMLRTHCEETHPEACRDVAGLGPAGVRELRRRLGLGMGMQAA